MVSGGNHFYWINKRYHNLQGIYFDFEHTTYYHNIDLLQLTHNFQQHYSQIKKLYIIL